MNTDSPILPAHLQARQLYAGFWRRVAAWLIDALIITAVAGALLALPGRLVPTDSPLWWGGHAGPLPGWIGGAWQPAGLIAWWLYFAVCEASAWQATPGKLALGLAVTDERGRRIGFARASGRYFGKYVSALAFGIGFALAGWTARKQALHDLMAGCCVVRKAGLSEWCAGADAGVDTAPSVGTATVTGMPGWAIALVVTVGGFFMLVPVLAVLAAIAIPAYHGHSVRAEVAEGIRLSERPRALVAEYIGQRGTLPDRNADLGLPQPEAIRASYVQSVRVVQGKVVVTYGHRASPAIRGGHVVLAPQGDAALLRWRCSSPDIRDRYLPDRCR